MKKLLALLIAGATIFSLAACKKEEAKPSLNELTTAEVTDLVLDEPTQETTTAVEVVTDKSGEEVTDKDGEKVTEVVTAAPTTTQTAAKKPETKEEIVNYFNTVINGVKPGAKSIKQHGVVNYLAKGDGATVIPSGIKGIYNTLGGDEWLDKMLQDNSQGEATYSGADIKAKFPVENETWSSKLSPSDVQSATCTEKNGIYTIVIKTLPDAKSADYAHGKGHNPKALSVALPGVINENIPGIAKGLVGTASMNYPSSTITIQVSAKYGKVLSAEYDAHWTINFDKMGIVLPFATKSTFTINWQ